MIGPVREWLYLGGLIKPVHLPACVVSIGNLSMGGTGKSPFVMLLSEWAVGKGISTAVLTRGYKRKYTDLEIVKPQASLPDVSRLGDEPWMIKNRVPGVSLLVHAKRAELAAQHWTELGAPRLVLLDDGFQHWRAARDRDVIMLDATESLRQGTFPFGRLRERAEALARADLIVITRAEAISGEELAALELEVRALAADPIRRPWKRAQSSRLRIVAAAYEFQEFFEIESGKVCQRPDLGPLVLASGIAKPNGLRRLVKSLGLEVSKEMIFPDHHRLSLGDVAFIRNALKEKDSSLLLTEKDWARWGRDLQGIRGFGIRVRFQFLGRGEETIHDFLTELEQCIISR